MTTTIELQQPVNGKFVLNRSAIGGTDVLATGGTAGLEWVEVTDDATAIVIRRGATRDGVTTKTEVGTVNASFVDALDPLDDPIAHRPGLPIRVRTNGVDIFTGVTENFKTRYNKATKKTFVNLTGVDAVKTLANIPRNGAASPVAECEPWPLRVERLFLSSGVPYDALPSLASYAAVLARSGSAEAGAWSGSWTASSPYLLANFNDGSVSTRTLTGLTVGDIYRVTLEWEPATWLSNPTVTTSPAGVTTGRGVVTGGLDHYVTTSVFVAETTTAAVMASCPAGYWLTLYSIAIERLPYQPQAANIVHDTDLASHLDIATTSAGVGWYVGADGVLRVGTGAGAAVLTLSDLTNGTDDAHASYTDLDVGYDTTGIVNALAVANHGRVLDAETGDYVAADTTLGPYLATGSRGTYGPKAAEVETAIYSGPEYPITNGAERLATSLLAAYADPELTVTSVDLNVTDRPGLVAALDIYKPISLTWRGHTFTNKIAAITHTITAKPKKHLVTLELMEA